MIYLLPSNDYEIFLGGNAIPEDAVLCPPTDRLLDALDTAGIPMTFFCDVTCLWRYMAAGRRDFVDTVERQLKTIISRGHDVQAHIHPHWHVTDIRPGPDGSTDFAFDHGCFSLGGLARRLDIPVASLARDFGLCARRYLETLLSPAAPSYRCVAYRAGGYAVQPHSQQVFAGLKAAGFLIDSSVVPGMVLNTNVNAIDFSRQPPTANHPIDRIGPDPAPANAGLFEIPVGAGHLGPLAVGRATVRRLANRGRSPARTGYGIQAAGPNGRLLGLAAKVARTVHFALRGWDMLELTDDADHLVRVAEHFMSRHAGERPLLFSFSCHSKTIDAAKLQALDTFVHRLRDRHGEEVNFIRFSDVPDILGTTLPEAAGPWTESSSERFPVAGFP